MAVHPLETYLSSLQEIHRTGGGTAERSYYGVFENLLNEVGRTLKPKVRCVAQLKDTGAGEPDFGLYTASQFQHAKDERPIEGALPERGVIEVKGWADDSFLTARKEQVSKYWRRYGLVLVTNYRDFVLVGRDDQGKPIHLETYRAARSEKDFHALLAHPRKAAQEQGDRFVEFLRRVMLHAAPLTNPEDLAWFLASHAREARARVEEKPDLPALEGLKKALEEALGMKFEGEKGEHFFRASLVQTLFYGVFSSWVLWCREHWGNRQTPFSWREAGWTLHVPMVKSLFDQIATPTRLKPLGIDEVLDWAGIVLNRVDRPAFFEKFEEAQAVQYFYEPFLQAYDPELRKELGVWYTPPEIVQYQVERVDRVLREELNIADGLADDRVVVLDPCCGTGAYLVETLKRIHKTLADKGVSALIAQKVKRAAIDRVFGFEILPAPFVVSHLQIGLMLRRIGVPLKPDSDERVGVYLTNALTGWEPPQKPKDELPLFPELMAERDAANRVKREAPILVILGNPPYNAYAGTSPDEEGGLVEPYKEGLTTPVEKGGWGIKKFNLDDLYVRFLRIAERRIVKSGRGVVSFISNYSWTCEPSFVVLRNQLLESFDKFWIENMHGNRKISEYAPDGRTSETIFAIPGFSPGIKQGIVVSLWVRREDHVDRPGKQAAVLYRDDINAARAVQRREQLLASLRFKRLDRKYQKANPTKANRFSFRPSVISNEYLNWPRVTDLCAIPPTNGLMEKRGGALIGIDRDALEARMKAYFDRSLDWESVKPLIGTLACDAAGYGPAKIRKNALAKESFESTRLVKYALRPFDNCWCYYSSVPSLWNRCRPAYWKQCWEGNSFFMARFRSTATPEGVPFHHVTRLSDDHFIVPDNACFPIRIRDGFEEPKNNPGQLSVFDEVAPYHTCRTNLSQSSRDYLKQIGILYPDKDTETAGLIWMHALAVGYSPAYLEENADGVRQDWPRIPLPKTRQALLKSAELGRRIAALLDTDHPIDGVTCGTVRAELKSVGVISKVGGGALNSNEGHLDLTAGWGHFGNGGACMPGKGKYEVRSQRDEKLKAAFGDRTLDVYLNDVAYWTNIPEPVWNYYIGGYQVIKKWLSYREKPLLGRGLKIEEVEYVTEMARRIAALILLQPELDINYRSVKSDAWPWPAG